MTAFSLCKAGYGSLAEINDLTVKEFLDLVEFEHISADIQNHLLNSKG